jgi:glucokinase
MLLAGDVGGTKTLLGLFAPGPRRPSAIDVRSYRTLDFPDLTELAAEFLRTSATRGAEIEGACFGVAGPVKGARAQLTNIPWLVDAAAIQHRLVAPRVHLLNDLEAMAWSIEVLASDEVEVLQEGTPDDRGNAALIAAGTGLGMALLHNVGGRLVPMPSEGGHADFAPRTADEFKLAEALISRFTRAQLEDVVSGRGIANIHRFVCPHECAEIPPDADPEALPSLISRAAMEGRCRACVNTLEVFVSAYGAAAGNLALTGLATAGLYLGGGIAPRILQALQGPIFLESFRAKAQMADLLRQIPVRVILNPEAALLGAAVYASASSTEPPRHSASPRSRG